jgi:predicted DNA-binding protein
MQQSIYMPTELKEKLEREAKVARRTFSNYIVTILEQHIEDIELADKELVQRPRGKRSRKAA